MWKLRLSKAFALIAFVSVLIGINVSAGHASLSATPTTWGAFFNDTPSDGSYLTYTSTSYFNIGASTDFTVAWWQYDTATPNSTYYPRIFQLGTSSNGNLSVSEENGTFYLWGPISTSFTMTTVLNTWVHYAIVRSGSTITIYENGVSKKSIPGASNAIGNASDVLIVGSAHNLSGNQTAVAFGGYLTGFEWIVGTAKYTSAFTPSSTLSSYTTSVTSGTKLLLFPTSAGTSTTDYSGNGITPATNVGSVAYGFQLTALSAPTAPTVAPVNGYAVSVSDTAVVNATSYVANVYTTSGSTFVESQTIASGSIGSPTQLSNLLPNTSYYVTITAVGDGLTYSNSPASSSSTVITALGSTASTLSDANNLSAIFRTVARLTLTTSGYAAGKATFYQSGKAIPGCKAIAVSANSAQCNWKAAQIGRITIGASFTPSSSNYLGSTSPAIFIVVTRRTTTR